MTQKSYAKVNIFLKIAAKRDNYHELVSRFVRVHSLYDTVSFVSQGCNEFTLEGEFGCETRKNTVYKAYILLKQRYSNVEEYFRHHRVQIEKRIPEFAGLGGGSSNAATFLIMTNEVCSLNLSKDELAHIGAQIGADVPFFVYEYDSANVTGIGEVVEKFHEKVLSIETITPKIQCNTGKIFTQFREKFYKEISKKEASKLLQMPSCDILKQLTVCDANDLFAPAAQEYPKLKEYSYENWFFSGSGSSFFRVIQNNEN